MGDGDADAAGPENILWEITGLEIGICNPGSALQSLGEFFKDHVPILPQTN